MFSEGGAIYVFVFYCSCYAVCAYAFGCQRWWWCIRSPSFLLALRMCLHSGVRGESIEGGKNRLANFTCWKTCCLCSIYIHTIFASTESQRKPHSLTHTNTQRVWVVERRRWCGLRSVRKEMILCGWYSAATDGIKWEKKNGDSSESFGFLCEFWSFHNWTCTMYIAPFSQIYLTCLLATLIWKFCGIKFHCEIFENSSCNDERPPTQHRMWYNRPGESNTFDSRSAWSVVHVITF